MDNDMILEIMKILIYPIIVLILCIIAMKIFAPQIRKLIDRIKKISKDGIETETTPQQTDPKKISAEDLLKMFDNRLLVETEQWITSELDKIEHTHPDQKQKLLVKLYASEKIARFFDQTYNSIFDSQIKALRYLNSFAGTYVEKEKIEPFYENAKIKYPAIYVVYNFENWLSFLERMALILRNRDSIGITVRGQEFLKYLIDQALPDKQIR